MRGEQSQLKVNRHVLLSFFKKAEQFLLLPRQLLECDIKKCNPKLYNGEAGRVAISRAKKILPILTRINLDLEKIKKILK